MNLYLRALKNTQICVTGRAPLTFTVNGCETLQAYREQLFDEVAAALEYCMVVKPCKPTASSFLTRWQLLWNTASS